MADMARHSDSGFLKLEVHHNLASVFLSYLRLHPPAPSLMALVSVDKLTKANPDLSWEMKLSFSAMAERIFEHKAAEAKDAGKENLTHWLNDYIEKHISEDLSLTRLAEVVHLNPVYLSRLYIQATGVGISDYVNMCRLNKSKELLKNSHHKIYEVAGMVGYDSALSFIRFQEADEHDASGISQSMINRLTLASLNPKNDEQIILAVFDNLLRARV